MTKVKREEERGKGCLQRFVEELLRKLSKSFSFSSQSNHSF
jgi:hypothetical protein